MSTACELLAESLSAYERVQGELEEFRGRVARAESEEAAVLANTGLSEAETINTAQTNGGRIRIYRCPAVGACRNGSAELVRFSRRRALTYVFQLLLRPEVQ